MDEDDRLCSKGVSEITVVATAIRNKKYDQELNYFREWYEIRICGQETDY